MKLSTIAKSAAVATLTGAALLAGTGAASAISPGETIVMPERNRACSAGAVGTYTDASGRSSNAMLTSGHCTMRNGAPISDGSWNPIGTTIDSRHTDFTNTDFAAVALNPGVTARTSQTHVGNGGVGLGTIGTQEGQTTGTNYTLVLGSDRNFIYGVTTNSGFGDSGGNFSVGDAHLGTLSHYITPYETRHFVAYQRTDTALADAGASFTPHNIG